MFLVNNARLPKAYSICLELHKGLVCGPRWDPSFRRGTGQISLQFALGGSAQEADRHPSKLSICELQNSISSVGGGSHGDPCPSLTS